MRKALFSCIFLFGSLIINAQNNSGVISYQEIIYTKPDLKQAEEQGWAEWASMVPDSVIFYKTLTFNSEASSFNNVPMEEEPGEQNMVKMMMRRYANPNNLTYRNVKENKFVEQKDFMGKTFLIKGEPEEKKWKMTGEMREIAGYPCLKAEYEDSTGVVDAWFTMQIPVSIGPETYGQLPGIILELYNPKEKKRLTANKVELKEVLAEEFVEPNKGKEVTREEFYEIVREKMKEMRESGGGFGMGKRH